MTQALNLMTRFPNLVLLGALILVSGCVDINDAKVQVQHPGEIDPYNQISLDKCPQHTSPHRLFTALTGSNSALAQGGTGVASNQQDFDKMWGYLSSVETGDVTTFSLTQKPVINWGQEIAYYLVVGADSSCQKTKPFGDEMNTDCYSITIPLYRYSEGTNCQPPLYFPVFIYILSAQKNIPINVQWVYPTPVPTATLLPTATPTPAPTATPRPTSLGKATPAPESEDE